MRQPVPASPRTRLAGPLLPQFVTGRADDCGVGLLVTIHTPLHRMVHFHRQHLPLLHRSMAPGAIHLGGKVPGVAEENIVRKPVHADAGNLRLSQGNRRLRRMTLQALGELRITSTLGLRRARVALYARQLQWGVLLMAERRACPKTER